jgi:hypothetical protein
MGNRRKIFIIIGDLYISEEIILGLNPLPGGVRGGLWM